MSTILEYRALKSAGPAANHVKVHRKAQKILRDDAPKRRKKKLTITGELRLLRAVGVDRCGECELCRKWASGNALQLDRGHGMIASAVE